jgi:hypothetical protein
MKFNIFNYSQQKYKHYCELKQFCKTLNQKDRRLFFCMFMSDYLFQKPVALIISIAIFLILVIFLPFYLMGQFVDFLAGKMEISRKAWFFRNERKRIYKLFTDFRNKK